MQKLKYKQKVYWVKGFPNNGRGWFLFKIPFINYFFVKDESGKIITCERVVDLIETIEDKERLLKDNPDRSNPYIYLNEIHHRLNKHFLNA